MRNRVMLAGSTTILTSILIVVLLFGNGWLAGSGAAVARAATRSGAAGATQRSVTVSDLQALFFVWASGTPAVQRLATQDCARLALSARQCAQISAATRAAWLDMAARDPSAVGRPGVRPNLKGRAAALDRLTASLTSAIHGDVASMLTLTQTTYTQISQRSWISANVVCCTLPYRLAIPPKTALVWGTSFTQNTLPGGLSPTTSPYAALPDAYLKYADWGQISNIPTFYQSYYAPTGTTAHWTVNIITGQGTRSIANVPITDVGPWNEDDNWWDPNGTSTTLPASCPVASPAAFPDATSNALVDGVCPTGAAGGNLRRTYYYLLYQHYGLPFFQRVSYQPSGSFADGTTWPTALAPYCSEAAAAAANTAHADGITCYGGTSSYNNDNGGWLRDGTYDSGITNQSSIDLSPAVNNALGWVYPSSGLVLVMVNALP